MARVSDEQVREYQFYTAQLFDVVVSVLRESLANVDLSDSRAVAEIATKTFGEFGVYSSELGRIWYQQCRDIETDGTGSYVARSYMNKDLYRKLTNDVYSTIDKYKSGGFQNVKRTDTALEEDKVDVPNDVDEAEVAEVSKVVSINDERATRVEKEEEEEKKEDVKEEKKEDQPGTQIVKVQRQKDTQLASTREDKEEQKESEPEETVDEYVPEDEAVIDSLAELVANYVQKVNRDTVVENLNVENTGVESAPGTPTRVEQRRDLKRTPQGKVAFMRVPTSTCACAFCIMMASRGPVYKTKESAGGGDEVNKYHIHCRCAVVPVNTDDPFVDGYDYGEYLDQYYDARLKWSSGDLSDDVKRRIARGKENAIKNGRDWKDINEIEIVMRDMFDLH